MRLDDGAGGGGVERQPPRYRWGTASDHAKGGVRGAGCCGSVAREGGSEDCPLVLTTAAAAVDARSGRVSWPTGADGHGRGAKNSAILKLVGRAVWAA